MKLKIPSTIEWVDGKIRIIDQTRLPLETVFLDCADVDTLIEAIGILRVRGAPALGVAGAMGVALTARLSTATDLDTLRADVARDAERIAAARPTAVNLAWGVERTRSVLDREPISSVEQARKELLAEANAILEEDRAMCRAIGRNGAQVIPDGANVQTHCNAGALATGGIGTALACIYQAVEDGKKVHVWVDETRPLLQGARLTAWELTSAGIPATLVCDSAAASLMRAGKVDVVITGADRIARNGDTANKIGTSGLAVLAHRFEVPFYIAAPSSTFDLEIGSGEEINIETRGAEEVAGFHGERVAPEGIAVYNPAFDVTDARYIRGFITELGLLHPPFDESVFEKQSAG